MNNIALIGYRGSGKSTVGKVLAVRLGMGFVDTDVRIVEREGKSIKAIFAEQGEAGFRVIESAVVRELEAQRGVVIACGGGVVLRPENVEVLRGGGKVVWLRGSVEELWARISGHDQSAQMRPNLTAAGGIEEVRTLLAMREPLYASAADIVVDAGKVEVAAIVDLVVKGLGLA